MTIRTHTFDSTGEAYDRSQCDGNIRDGDVLHVPSERAVAVFCGAWPIAVTRTYGEFDRRDPAAPWSGIEDGRYLPSLAVAERLATVEEYEVDGDA